MLANAGCRRRDASGCIGRRTSSPPQFGHWLLSHWVTQSTQNVYSNEQMHASFDAGGRSLSQHSQLGQSSSMVLSYC